MVFNLGSLVRLLNRLFGTNQTTIYTQSASQSDYGVFYTFKRTGAILELRSSLRDGFAMVTPGTGLTIVDSYGQFQYTPYGQANLGAFISYEVNWSTLSVGAFASRVFTRSAWVTWTKIPNTDDNQIIFKAEQFNVGANVYEIQYAITNQGAGAVITAMTGTLPSSGITRLYLNLDGISFTHA